MKLKNYALVVLFGLFANQSYAQYITTTGFPNSHSISNDGIIAGYDQWAGPYYLWNPNTDVIETIGGIAPGDNHGGVATFSEDGKYISGTSISGEDPTIGEMSRYNTITKQWETLGYNYNTNLSGSDLSAGYYISGDGNTVVGLSYIKGVSSEGQEAPKAIAYAWNNTKGVSILERSSAASRQSRANAVSRDGSVVVGWEDVRGPWKAQVWKRNTDGTYQKGQYLLIDPKGSATNEFNQLGEARAISGDGKWIGGKSDGAYPNAWIWNEEKGLVDLGTLATPDENNVVSWVTSINYDGSVVLGYTISKQWIDSAPVYKPFIWTKEKGMQNFNDYVTTTLKFDTKGDQIYVPTMLSANEKYIVGWGLDGTNVKVFRVELPKLSTDEVATSDKATLYPNPVTNMLNIDSKTQINQIKVYNLTGQQILLKEARTKNPKIDLSTLKAGMYLVEVISESNTTTYKVIKK